VREAAVSAQSGSAEFIRVLGNTTGSHLAGAKPSPYGDLERFPVALEAIGPLVAWADLLKIDAEGAERDILLAVSPENWARADAVVEVGSAANAEDIFRHFAGSEVNLFSQKTGWRKVKLIEEMPTSYRDGSLFVSARPEMPWREPCG
jgi:hypothetical protein